MTGLTFSIQRIFISLQIKHRVMRQIFLMLLVMIVSTVCVRAQTADSVMLYESTMDRTMYDEIAMSGDYVQQAASADVPTLPPAVFDYKKTAEWGRYKALRAVGWSFLGVGVVSFFGGVYEALLEFALSGKNSVAGPIMVISGGVLTMTSIPILIVAYNNRRKAKRMSLDFGMSRVASPSLAANTLVASPALSLRLSF